MAECYYCGRRFPQLYKVTAEDIQRQYPPTLLGYEVACADCLDNLHSAASLVPQQTVKRVARHLAWTIPLISLALISTAILVSIARIQGVGEILGSSRWIGSVAILFGILMVWDRSKNRYACTHDLRWSLNAKRVNLAFAVLASGIILLIVSGWFAR